MNNTELSNRRKLEEIVNSVTHGIGFLGAIALTTILVVRAALHGNAWHIVTFSIFGVGMMMLYLASTLYHSATNLRTKSHLNNFDHASIYVLIAATYTPITLVGIQGAFGWTIFGVVWALAIAGVIFKLKYYQVRLRKISTFLYIGMGWMLIIAIVPLIKKFPPVSLWYLLIGGISYSLGTLFYLKRKMPFGHGLFHIFVLGGSICHFYAIYFLL